VPEPYSKEAIFAGLRELADSAFPKRCANCGREYQNSAEFFEATHPVRANISGLKQSIDDDGRMIVDLFRNCVCGSTLLESYENRRNSSEEGVLRRKRFLDMVDQLVAFGCPEDTARSELLKFMRGQPNDLLSLTRDKNIRNP
jgi:hypothetical protein